MRPAVPMSPARSADKAFSVLNGGSATMLERLESLR
jgi:hypothetical protein